MAKTVIWTVQDRADVRAIDRETALRLLQTLARFLVTEEGDVSKLTDIEPPEFRLRIGDYRVRFYDLGDSIELLRVRNRKDAHR